MPSCAGKDRSAGPRALNISQPSVSVAIAQLEGRLDTTLFERTRAGILHGEVNHELMVDNILDLSHIKVLHPG